MTDEHAVARIARFWEARARESALRFSLPGAPAGPAGTDQLAFAASGRDLLDAAAELVGWRPSGLRLAVDVGCGAGRLLEPLSRLSDAVIAVDVAPTMIETAQEIHGHREGFSWLVGHAGALEGVADAAADAVLALGVLTHLPTQALQLEALAELARVLLPGGAALFDVRDRPAPLELPGESAVPDRVARHPLWRGVPLDLETLAGAAAEEGLELERIAGSGSGRCLVLARRA
ncbi:methyltransferase domain-containing protein [Patulibacter brassicae]|uniref:Methyltransferase domain-containing protein n=1 Tax=Patulibacter brassicae TaxID=1705717 RepID=A0ABU4VE09_9ACTN|nr:methyltransferase domain-containing protein [Patulibacter brassicae]MDX8150028.1 methyltransferase domain-containing protein [Patulibacter brassicae]